MTRVANNSGRAYRSQLRADQAEETRERILDATVRVMAAGLASVSIPAVAREAGVSVPTIYRHFGTKRDLLAALYPHIARRAGLGDVIDPHSLDELRDGVRAIFSRLDSLDDLARAAVASPAAEEARHVTMPDRVERIRQFADTIVPGLSKVDRDRIARLLVILTSSSALRVWRDHLGASVDEAADDVSADELPAAMDRCLASARAARAAEYQPASDGRMAVIIQRMVTPASAGVVLTADPINGDRRSCRLR